MLCPPDPLTCFTVPPPYTHTHNWLSHPSGPSVWRTGRWCSTGSTTMSTEPSTQLTSRCGAQCMWYIVFVLCIVQYIVSSIYYAVFVVHHVSTVQCIVCRIECAVYLVHHVCTVHCTVYSVQCIVCSAENNFRSHFFGFCYILSHYQSKNILGRLYMTMWHIS